MARSSNGISLISQKGRDKIYLLIFPYISWFGCMSMRDDVAKNKILVIGNMMFGVCDSEMSTLSLSISYSIVITSDYQSCNEKTNK